MEERDKHFEVSKKFQQYREERTKRAGSKEGRELMKNRGIQAEGVFSSVKSAMKFRRFLTKGIENVRIEAILYAMAHDILKLHFKIQKPSDEKIRRLFRCRVRQCSHAIARTASTVSRNSGFNAALGNARMQFVIAATSVQSIQRFNAALGNARMQYPTASNTEMKWCFNAALGNARMQSEAVGENGKRSEVSMPR